MARRKRSKKEYSILESQIVDLHKSLKSYSDIEALLDVSKKFIWSSLKKHGYVYDIRYNSNSEFFKNIDSFDKSHILGVLFADGYISSNRNLFGISLQKQDITYLNDINQRLESTYPINLIKNSYRLEISNKKMKDDLIKWGFTSTKSYDNIDFPKLPDKLLSSFILGYFEGDGCIGVYPTKYSINAVFNILAQEKFAIFIQHYLSQKLGISVTIYNKSDCKNNLKVISIRKFRDMITLYHFLYENASFVMKRKHDKWMILMNLLKDRGYEVGEIYNFNFSN